MVVVMVVSFGPVWAAPGLASRTRPQAPAVAAAARAPRRIGDDDAADMISLPS